MENPTKEKGDLGYPYFRKPSSTVYPKSWFSSFSRLVPIAGESDQPQLSDFALGLAPRNLQQGAAPSIPDVLSF